MVERVKIAPTEFRLNDAAGNPVFYTDFKYIKTATPGTMLLAQLATAPAPWKGDVILNNDGGHPSINTFNPTVESTFDVFRAPSNGQMSFRPCALAYGGTMAIPYQFVANAFTIGTLRRNGADIMTVYAAPCLMIIPQQEMIRPVGSMMIMSGMYIANGATPESATGIGFSVNAGDLVSLHVIANPTIGYTAFNLFHRFFSTDVTLPLQVTT